MGNARENFDKQKKEVGEKGRDKFYGILAKEYKVKFVFFFCRSELESQNRMGLN